MPVQRGQVRQGTPSKRHAPSSLFARAVLIRASCLGMPLLREPASHEEPRCIRLLLLIHRVLADPKTVTLFLRGGLSCILGGRTRGACTDALFFTFVIISPSRSKKSKGCVITLEIDFVSLDHLNSGGQRGYQHRHRGACELFSKGAHSINQHKVDAYVGFLRT